MIEQGENEDILTIIREIEVDPAATQRSLAGKLGISLGKTNYLLKELIKRGLIKAKHFSENPGKLRKISYILTKEGFERKVFLIEHFLAIKEAEYALLKKEWVKLTDNNKAREGEMANKKS